MPREPWPEPDVEQWRFGGPLAWIAYAAALYCAIALPLLFLDWIGWW